MSVSATNSTISKDDLPAVGEFVEDRKSSTSKTLVVLEVHPHSTVRGWYVYDVDALLVDAFPDADPRDRVVTVAYADELVAKVSIDDLAEVGSAIEVAERADVSMYDYPSNRLKSAKLGDE